MIYDCVAATEYTALKMCRKDCGAVYTFCRAEAYFLQK